MNFTKNLEMKNLNNKSILVTGGTGSFGHKVIEILVKKFKPKRLVIFSRDENKQYEMQNIYKKKQYPYVRFFLGDIRDKERLITALKDIEIVIHAAALKHVDQAEYNPFEFIKTNVIGANNLVTACQINSVKKFINISTDKATNPINLYGASKLAADKIFLAANNVYGKKGTKFSVVKYGNVLNSRGSVIPFFFTLVKNKAKFLPVTDKRMTRFFIKITDGVNFVLTSIKDMKGGEIFIPKMPSIKIMDIAEVIAGEIPIKIVGKKNGEKIHEILVTPDDVNNLIIEKDRFIITPFIRKKNPKKIFDNFQYSSNVNTDWIKKNEILNFLKS